jgi:RNase H-like domain found in reverse transcriptase/Integrase zinc binding domain
MPQEDLEKNADEQRHEPLAFISGRFVQAMYNWSVPEKEAFAIVAAMTRLRYLTVMRTVHVYTDHRNLMSIYDPNSSNPSIASYVASKLQRWGGILSEFDYAAYHIDGKLNYFADLMTRWAVSKLQRQVTAPVSTPDADVNEQQLIDLVKASQADLSEVEKKRLDLKLKQSLLWMGDRVYVPRSAVDVKMRLLIVAHCGRSGHRPYDETRGKLLQGFVWDNMNEDMQLFLRNCIHCLSTSEPYRIPRPLMQALHAILPNQLLHFDNLYIEPSISGCTCVLILKDDPTNYTWLRACKNADGDSAVQAILEWCSAFGIVHDWCSDQGRHFVILLMQSVARELRVKHRFTTAYAAWANGTVEVVCRSVLSALRKLCSEFSLAFTHGRRCYTVCKVFRIRFLLPSSAGDPR